MIKEDGSVVIIGENDHGQCDVPKLGKRTVLQVALGGYHSALLLDDDSVLMFGNNEHGQCNVPLKKLPSHEDVNEDATPRVTMISCGR